MLDNDLHVASKAELVQKCTESWKERATVTLDNNQRGDSHEGHKIWLAHTQVCDKKIASTGKQRKFENM